MTRDIRDTLNDLKVFQNPRAYGNVVAKTTDYTITISDITNGTTLMIDTTAGDVTLTLPDPSGLPNDSAMYSINIHHPSGGNDVIINNPYTWIYNVDKLNFGSAVFATIVAGYNNGVSANFGLMRNLTVLETVHRDTDWSSANFSTSTAVPFDVSPVNGNAEMIRWEQYELDNFTSVSDGGGGLCTFEGLTGHSFEVGDHVHIDGTYSGYYLVDSVTATTVSVVAGFSATDADAIMKFDRLWFAYSGAYDISYTVDIDSTSGTQRWNMVSQIFKGVHNGVAPTGDDSTLRRTGNYQQEDGGTTLPCTVVDITAGDYIELQVDHTNLTGNLTHAMLSISIRL